MRNQLSLCCLSVFLCWFQVLAAQSLLQQKDVAFAQMAVGPTFETVLTMTNRGGFPYTGTLNLSRGLQGDPWSPLVNGQTIEDGAVPVEMGVDETITLRLTGGVLQSGMGVLIANDVRQDNFVEASLTYFVYPGEQGSEAQAVDFQIPGRQVIDSVGIQPSVETYLATIPFENFSQIGLALGNAPPSWLVELGRANVIVTLLGAEGGEPLATKNLTLEQSAHSAEFLFEMFPGVTLGRGKVEIASDLPIVGTAITVANRQLSSLPLLPAPVAYTVRMSGSDGTVFEGELSLWAEGYFVKGYLVILALDGVFFDDPLPAILVNGQLVDGYLDLSFFVESKNLFGDPSDDELLTLYLGGSGFSFDQQSPTGTWTLLFLSDQATLTGDYLLERTTP